MLLEKARSLFLIHGEVWPRLLVLVFLRLTEKILRVLWGFGHGAAHVRFEAPGRQLAGFHAAYITAAVVVFASTVVIALILDRGRQAVN